MSDSGVKGWCPGALRPMESGDGLIVRVRPRHGVFPLGALAAVAGAAGRFGNGVLDLTRRGNLQIRGVRIDTLVPLLDVLGAEGLLDATVAAEAVRNVLVSPLAGIDSEAAGDPAPVAVRLETVLAHDLRLQALPGKFGFSVDGGGRLPLGADGSDIRIMLEADGSARIAFERPDGEATVTRVWRGEAADEAARLAAAVLPALRDGRRRLKDLPEAELRNLVDAPIGPSVRPMRRTALLIGPITNGAETVAIGAAAPFGRVDAAALEKLCAELAAVGVPDIRVSPWRAIYLPVRGEEAAREAVLAAGRAGFTLDATDPLLSIDACPGAPACISAGADTRTAARILAPHLARAGVRSVHISGCRKGCARSQPADLVLVADRGRFAVVRNGTAQSPSNRTVPADDPVAALDEVAAHV